MNMILKCLDYLKEKGSMNVIGSARLGILLLVGGRSRFFWNVLDEGERPVLGPLAKDNGYFFINLQSPFTSVSAPWFVDLTIVIMQSVSK